MEARIAQVEYERTARQRVEPSAALVKCRRDMLARRAKLASIPQLREQVEALRQFLRSKLFAASARPATDEPVREVPPETLQGEDRVAFNHRALAKYKTALANWLEGERERLQKIVDNPRKYRVKLF